MLGYISSVKYAQVQNNLRGGDERALSRSGVWPFNFRDEPSNDSIHHPRLNVGTKPGTASLSAILGSCARLLKRGTLGHRPHRHDATAGLNSGTEAPRAA